MTSECFEGVDIQYFVVLSRSNVILCNVCGIFDTEPSARVEVQERLKYLQVAYY